MLTTHISREDNPKAVFVGQQTPLINAIASYLIDHGVEIFSGDKNEDAFFGQYFIFNGQEKLVKDFVVNNYTKLPKSLFILSKCSDEFKNYIEKLKSKHFKILIINININPTQDLVKQIINLVFDNKSYILDLSYLLPIEDFVAKINIESQTKETENKNKLNISDALINTTPKNISKLTQKEIDETIRKSDIKIQTSSAKNIRNLFVNNNSLNIKSSKKNAHKFKGYLIFISIITMLLTVCFPFLLFLLNLFISLSLVYHVYKGGYRNLPVASQELNFAKFTTSNSIGLWQFLFPLWEIVKQEQFAEEISGGLDLLNQGTEVVQLSLKIGEDALILNKEILNVDRSIDIKEIITNIQNNVSQVDTKLALIEAKNKTSEIDGLCNSQWVFFAKKLCLQRTEKIAYARKISIQAKKAIPLLSETIGLFGQKKYLIILQNNMELRPTGGFIGSYVLATFDEGKLKNTEVSDVYSADGQLKGHVDPPDAIRVYLGQEHWYMRDSNWDPDFSKSAVQIAWFLNKELGENIDGVWAVDLTVAKDVMKLLGSINLPDFQTQINADDLFVKTHQITDENFFPGSTQKKDFISALYRKLIDEILSKQNFKNWQALQVFYNNLQTKHIQLFDYNTNIESVIKNLGWSGELVNVGCEGNCFADYVSVVDANLGVNKSNYYINRKMSDSIIFTDKQIQHSLNINYQNTSPASEDNQKIGGYYKNYLRIYLPKSAQIVEVNENNKLLKLTTDKIASKSSVVFKNNQDFTTVEALVEVKPGSETDFSLTYVIPVTYKGNNLNYQLFWRKQAGTEKDPINLKVKYPPNWLFKPQFQGVVIGSQVGLVKDSGFEYNTDLAQDRTWTFNITR